MNAEDVADGFSKTSANIKVACERDGHTLVLSIVGALDLVAATEAQELLVSVLAAMKARETLVVDIGEVGYISSAGVGALTTALSAARKRDVELKLRGIQPKIRSVFELLGFMSFFSEVP